MAGVPEPPVTTPDHWGARKPAQRAQRAGTPVLGVFHHTAGHHPELDKMPAESFAECVAYAQAMQAFHMDERGWNDTGQNFTVFRNGRIFTGRWGSLTAIRAGRMVVSAHCPGQNDQPGIEHEHKGEAAMTAEQLNASAWLWAYICSRTGIRPTQYFGHHVFFATSCPAQLDPRTVRARAAAILTRYGYYPRRSKLAPRALTLGGVRP